MDHAPSLGSHAIASLNLDDNYDSFLLNILKAYTQHQIETKPTTGSEVFTISDISPEALNFLSQEQVLSLITSSALNYDVIQQILAYKQKTEVGGGEVCLAGVKSMESKSGLPVGAEKVGGSAEEALSALQQLQALQLSPEQLKQIHLQMAELLRTKQIVLPTELSLEQQQQLLQSLILRQVHVQQQQQQESRPPTSQTLSSAASGGGSTAKSPVTVGSTLAALLGKEESRAMQIDDKMTTQIKVPPPLSAGTENTTIRLESNPAVRDYSMAMMLHHTT